MLPILYESNTTDFNNNGLGFVRNCTKCKVVEVRNGLYELELEMLTNDRLADNIAVSKFLKAPPNPHDDPQIFEIYQMSAADTKITAKAQHLKYIAFGNVTDDLYNSPIARTPSEHWTAVENLLALRPNYFTFSSDITTKAIVKAGKDCPIRLGDFLSGSEGSMLDTFGGEFHYNNFNIELLENRGTNTGIAIRYGSNISSYQQDSDISTVYSHLLPYATVNSQYYESGKSAGERKIFSDLIDLNNNNLTYKRALAYDFADEFKGDEDTLIIYEDNLSYKNLTELKAKLETVAGQYVRKNHTALTEISVNITVDVAETLKTLENCKLCDTVKVYFEPLGFSANAKIVKTEYDVLLEKYTKIELGTIKKTIADLFSGKNIGGV